MPKKAAIKKVLVIGSGPIIIGQAAEFDYAGTQACKALREEGIEVVLVNSNPATIMTDANIAEKVYIEPLTVEFFSKIIRQEKPDGLLPTLGGQTGLNLAVQLAEAGVLAEEGVELLGTPLESIKKAEDRELFKATMLEIGEPVPESTTVNTVEEAFSFVSQIGYPVVIRPAFTLGGSGGGFASNDQELLVAVEKGLQHSPIHQVLIEQSVAGWKEIEYEVMRDSADNCITICNMENFDAIGVHTGDSIVAAPSQTLSDAEYQMLRTASLKIIRALGIEGGCNVQFALHPKSFKYYVIEVNPRVSRSSALASKATGYPIAKVAAKIAAGFTMDEIINPITRKTYACSEPAIDYVVVKIPRWPFDKFEEADRHLGTQMKATGEVMAIGRSFEAALLKAVRSLEAGFYGLTGHKFAAWNDSQIMAGLAQASDERLFILAEAFRRRIDAGRIAQVSAIDPFFLHKIQKIVKMEETVRISRDKWESEVLKTAKRMGLADKHLSELTGRTEEEIRQDRKNAGIRPGYKMVDTCAAEFPAVTPYYYSCFGDEDEGEESLRQKVLVLGSGPIRIGQGIEFDYCSVHCVWALKEAGYETVIINNNPETVSTDFDTADRLYFEPLTLEDVLNVIEKEKPQGVVVQFGGQTAINLAGGLAAAGVKILGTPMECIDMAEDREKFDCLLSRLGIPRPQGRTAISVRQALDAAGEIGYPVLVRPSYVLGGRAMEIVYSDQELVQYMETAVQASPEHPVLVDKYLQGTEIEVDAIGDGQGVLIPGIMQHIERAGVHSGDSIAVYPAALQPHIQAQIVEYTMKIAMALKVQGLLNIQYVIHQGEVFILEVNPRASRTVPYLSKVTGIPMVNLATKAMLGASLPSMGYRYGLHENGGLFAVKAPVFSFGKLAKVDVGLSPEMKSTGEVMGIDRSLPNALYKALLASGLKMATKGTVLVTVADRDKKEMIPIVRRFVEFGFKLYATEGTALALEAAGLTVEGRAEKIGKGQPDILDMIRGQKIDYVINTITKGKEPGRDGFAIRRAAVESNVPCFTSLDTVSALLEALTVRRAGSDFTCTALQDLGIEQTRL